MAKTLLLVFLAAAVVRLLTRAALRARSFGSIGGGRSETSSWGPFSSGRTEASASGERKERREGELIRCQSCGVHVPRQRARDLRDATLCGRCSAAAD